MGKHAPKTRGLPRLPANDIVINSDALDLIHLERMNAAQWLLMIYLRSGQRLISAFTSTQGPLSVWQELEPAAGEREPTETRVRADLGMRTDEETAVHGDESAAERPWTAAEEEALRAELDGRFEPATVNGWTWDRVDEAWTAEIGPGRWLVVRGSRSDPPSFSAGAILLREDPR